MARNDLRWYEMNWNEKKWEEWIRNGFRWIGINKDVYAWNKMIRNELRVYRDLCMKLLLLLGMNWNEKELIEMIIY